MLQAISIPYGFNFLNGELVEDDFEQRVIAHLEIWWSEGMSFDNMANKLNDKNIPTKRNRIWAGATVSRILSRERGCL